MNYNVQTKDVKMVRHLLSKQYITYRSTWISSLEYDALPAPPPDRCVVGLVVAKSSFRDRPRGPNEVTALSGFLPKAVLWTAGSVGGTLHDLVSLAFRTDAFRLSALQIYKTG